METNQIVDNVINSQCFQNKEVLKGLLKFLYAAHQRGETLKEADIAVGYFKRGRDFVPGEDTIVRVNIYKLRSLLEKYFQEEGKDDSMVLEIPKGSYQLVFRGKIKAVPVEPVKPVKRIRWAAILALCLGISIVLNILSLFKEPERPETKNPIWDDYVRNGKPVYITLGDPFFFRVKDTSSAGGLIVRDITVNSVSDLKSRDFGKIYKANDELSELNYPYFSRNNLWPLPDIISFFAKAGVETRLQALSESKIDDVKNNDVVFIGNINSFGWMNKFLETSHIRLHTNPREIHILKPKNSTILSVPEVINGAYTDYALLVKVPGPNNNAITMLGDFHASGVRGLTRFISSKKNLEKLNREVAKKYPDFPEYFEMVVKVTSYDYSDFETEIIYFNKL